MLKDIQYSFGEVEIIKVDGLEGEFGFITPVMMEVIMTQELTVIKTRSYI